MGTEVSVSGEDWAVLKRVQVPRSCGGDGERWGQPHSLPVTPTAGIACPCSSLRAAHLSRTQVHTQLLLALVAIAHAQWREALQLLASLLDTPTGLYNYCLLQCRVGVVMGGASGWLEKRSKMPRERSEARERLRESQQLLSLATYVVHCLCCHGDWWSCRSGCEREYAAMDVAMLKLWLQHNR